MTQHVRPGAKALAKRKAKAGTQKILVKNQTASANNGIHVVTAEVLTEIIQDAKVPDVKVPDASSKPRGKPSRQNQRKAELKEDEWRTYP